MKKIYFYICLVVVSTGTIAQSTMDIFKLTANHVEHFIENFPKLYAEFKEIGVEYNVDEGEFNLPKSEMEIKKINLICKKYSYSDYSVFINQASAILLAYAVIASEESMEESRAEILEAIDRIKIDNTMTTDQKKIAIEQLEVGLKLMNSYSENSALSANVSVVEQYNSGLRKLFEEFDAF